MFRGLLLSLLCFVVTLSPAQIHPASGANNQPVSSRADIAAKASSKSATLVAVQQEGAPKASEVSTTNPLPQPIDVRVLPKLSVTKDWADYAVWIFSALLVVVGALQAGIMRKTLPLMKGQMLAMNKQIQVTMDQVQVAKDAADAAKRSVDLMIAKERARIEIKITKFQFTEPMRVEYKVTCYGVTPAIVQHSWMTSAVLTSSVAATDLLHYSMSLSGILRPGDFNGVAYAVNHLTEGKKLEVEVRDGKQFIHLMGEVSYKDIFGMAHLTSIYQIYQATDLKNLDGTPFCFWSESGLSDWNKET